MKLKQRCPPNKKWGYADFFNDRHKLKILDLAEINPSDVVYDLGCGDGSLLIFAVKKYRVAAVGFEKMPQRIALVNKKIENEKLQNKITIKKDMYDADLENADVILDMMPEGEADLQDLYSKNIRKGTRLIKHDLPLMGYLPDKVDYPFYRMTFPLQKARSKKQWAFKVLGQKNVNSLDIWHELYYYQYEKGYSLTEIKIFEKLLKNRVKS